MEVQVWRIHFDGEIFPEPEPEPQVSGDEFTVVWIPDTQKVVESWPHIFDAQCRWCSDSVEIWNIQAVMHVGDIVDNGGDDLPQWDEATDAIALLDTNNLPYSFSVGNHDYDVDNGDVDRTTTLYNTLLPQSRYTSKDWWNGGFYDANDSENHYLILTIGGQDYLFLSLEYGPRQAVVNWANTIVAANPNSLVLINTHVYLYNDGTRTSSTTQHSPHNAVHPFSVDVNDGTELWDELVKLHENIIYVQSGHHVFGANGARLVSQGDNGNTVNQVFCNFQDEAMGGNGYMRLVTFAPSTREIRVKTYSPHTGLYLASSEHEFTLSY